MILRVLVGWLQCLLRISWPIIPLALFGTARVWAQDYSNQFSAPLASTPPYGERIVELLIAAALGFGIGAFFSPLLKPFRQAALLVALAGAVLFARYRCESTGGGLSARFLLPAGPVTIPAGETVAIICATSV